jgi:hypothetical protein
MWGTISNKKRAIKKAIEFTSDHKKYGRFMVKVILTWPISCENALTDRMLNRKAWIGHAAVALALGIPENITREAWGQLTSEQQLLANREAERAISIWEHAKEKNISVQEALDEKMLF